MQRAQPFFFAGLAAACLWATGPEARAGAVTHWNTLAGFVVQARMGTPPAAGRVAP
jgi:hypothetical protein